jgi:hypothetical protein
MRFYLFFKILEFYSISSYQKTLTLMVRFPKLRIVKDILTDIIFTKLFLSKGRDQNGATIKDRSKACH